MKYEIERKNASTQIIDKDSNYNLTIYDIPSYKDMGSIHFWAPVKNSLVNKIKMRANIPVTSRSVKEYPKQVIDHKINPDFQYIEVGAGHGEFIPSIVRSQNNSPKVKPIVIEPANYELMRELLLFSLENLDMQERNVKILNETLDRNRIITNPLCVTLINKTLGEAVLSHPEIHNIADFLVDSCGAITYPETEIERGDLRSDIKLGHLQLKVEKLEKKLLKGAGEYVFFPEGVDKSNFK